MKELTELQKEQGRQLLAKFKENGVDFADLQKLTNISICLASVQVLIEDDVADIYKSVGLYAQNRKQTSNKIIELLEKRDRENVRLIEKKFINNLSDDSFFFKQLLIACSTRFASNEDRLKILSTIKMFKEEVIPMPNYDKDGEKQQTA